MSRLGFRTVEMSFFKMSRKSRLSRCRFSNCRENLDCRDVVFQTVKIETLDWDLNKNQEISIFRVIKTVETWFLNCQDVIFKTVKKISTVEMSFFKLSRSRLSIETRSRQIVNPTLNCLSTFVNLFRTKTFCEHHRYFWSLIEKL